MRKRRLLLFGGLCAVALLIWLWQSDRSPITEPKPAQTADSVVAPPVPNSQPSAEGDATPKALQPPGEGEAFVAAGPGGLRLHGRLWRAASKHAPLILLIPDDRARARDWRPMITLLRQVRDYHVAAWDALALKDDDHGGVRRLRELVGVETIIEYVQTMVGGGALGLVGVGSGGTAALLLAAERRDVMATVAISPMPALGSASLSAAISVLGQRQVLVAAAEKDTASMPVLRQIEALPHARVVRVPGAVRGLDLLTGSRQLQAKINGWLYASMGPVRR